MAPAPSAALQLGLPEFVPELLGVVGLLVLGLIIVAMGGFVYRHLTGGVEWPDDREDDDDAVRSGDPDDEWEYY